MTTNRAKSAMMIDDSSHHHRVAREIVAFCALRTKLSTTTCVDVNRHGTPPSGPIGWTNASTVQVTSDHTHTQRSWWPLGSSNGSPLPRNTRQSRHTRESSGNALVRNTRTRSAPFHRRLPRRVFKTVYGHANPAMWLTNVFLGFTINVGPSCFKDHHGHNGKSIVWGFCLTSPRSMSLWAVFRAFGSGTPCKSETIPNSRTDKRRLRCPPKHMEDESMQRPTPFRRVVCHPNTAFVFRSKIGQNTTPDFISESCALAKTLCGLAAQQSNGTYIVRTHARAHQRENADVATSAFSLRTFRERRTAPRSGSSGHVRRH